jgi:hypothetical protein
MTVSTRKLFETKVRLALSKERMLSHGGAVGNYRTAVTGKIQGVDMLLFLALANYHDIAGIGALLNEVRENVLFKTCYAGPDRKSTSEAARVADLALTLEMAPGFTETAFETVCLWLDCYNELLDTLTLVHKEAYRMHFLIKKLKGGTSLKVADETAAAIVARALAQPEPARFALIVNNTIRGDDNTVAAYRLVGFANGAPVIKALDKVGRVGFEHAIQGVVNYVKMLAKVPYMPQREESRSDRTSGQGKGYHGAQRDGGKGQSKQYQDRRKRARNATTARS